MENDMVIALKKQRNVLIQKINWIDTQLAGTNGSDGLFTLREIERVVVSIFGIGIKQLHSRSRKREIVYARFMCWYILKKYWGMTYKRIGGYYVKDHATVMNGVKKAGWFLESDGSFRRKFHSVINKLELPKL